MESAAVALPSSLLSLGAPLELLLKASALLLVAMLCAFMLRRRSAASRHLAWTLGVTGVLLLPAASALLPSWRIAVPVEVTRAEGSPVVAPRAPRAPVALRGTTAEEAPKALPARRLPPRASGLPLGAIMNALGIAWALGSAIALARFAAAVRSALRLARGGRAIAGHDEVSDLAAVLGLTARIRLVESEVARVPMTLGALRPVIVVPEGFASWEASRRHAVLLHELAHVQRHDWLIQCVAQLGCVAFWFHPLVRLAARSLRQEAEQAADDLVLAHGTKPSSYAAHLVELVRSLQPMTGSHAMTVSMIGGPFDGRIRAILESSRSRGPVPARLRFMLVAASAAAWLALSAVDVTAEPAASPKAPPEPSTWTQVCDAVHEAMRHVHAQVRALHGGNAGDDMYDGAMDLHRAGQYEAAIAAFQKVIDAGYRTDAASYNIACGHARLGHADEAMTWLQRAVDEGFAVGRYLEDDDDLASLRGDARFQRFARENADVDERAALRQRLARLRATNATNAEAWADVGGDLHAEGQHADAAEAYARAAALDPQSETVLYNLACARSLDGDTEGALDALEQAIEAGYDDADHMREDSDLDPIRDAERYEQLAHDVELLDGPAHVTVFGFDLGDDASAWKQAATHRESFVKAHPRSGAGWFQLGFAALRSGDPERGIVAFGKAHDLGHRPGTSAYNVACSNAVAGHRDAAFEWLARAASEGFDVRSQAAGDDDLASLRADPRFAPYMNARTSVVQRVFEF